MASRALVPETELGSSLSCGKHHHSPPINPLLFLYSRCRCNATYLRPKPSNDRRLGLCRPLKQPDWTRNQQAPSALCVAFFAEVVEGRGTGARNPEWSCCLATLTTEGTGISRGWKDLKVELLTVWSVGSVLGETEKLNNKFQQFMFRGINL